MMQHGLRFGWVALLLSLSLLPVAYGQSTGPATAAQQASPSGASFEPQPDGSATNLAQSVRSAPGPPDHAAVLSRRDVLLASISIFVLAVFLGFEVINKVPPILHTPLMSGSNAISGITLVGALASAGAASSGWLIPLLGTGAVIFATINVIGGFAVTHRMLTMFRRKS